MPRARRYGEQPPSKPAPKVESLPKWAQDRIERLEGRLKQTEEALAAVHGGRLESKMQVHPGEGEPAYGLAEWGTVRFQLGDQRYMDDQHPRHWIEARFRDGKVELIASSALTLYSRSSNVVYVDVEDRYELTEDATIRDLGQRLIRELTAKGLGFQDGLNLIEQADPEQTKKLRLFDSGD